MKYITSDLHFGHQKICGPDGFVPIRRQFKDANEMNETIIDNWNQLIRPHDTVYVLGDAALNLKPRELEAFLSRLNGVLYLVKGNHDDSKSFKYLAKHNPVVHYNKQVFNKYNFIPMGTIEKRSGVQYYLTHYPQGLGESRKSMRNLCGHIHELAAREANVLNVGIDSPEIGERPFGQPILLDEAMDLVDKKWQLWFSQKGGVVENEAYT